MHNTHIKRSSIQTVWLKRKKQKKKPIKSVIDYKYMRWEIGGTYIFKSSYASCFVIIFILILAQIGKKIKCPFFNADSAKSTRYLLRRM